MSAKDEISLAEAERYAAALLEFVGTPYAWGEETPKGSDCSGSVCFALAAATGLALRMTAEGLYRTVFTERVAEEGGIEAAFFVDHAGRIPHVAGLIARTLAVNVSEPMGRVREVAELRRVYERLGYRLELRALNRTEYAKRAFPVRGAA